MSKTLYKKDKWKDASNEQKLSSYLNREKNSKHWELYKENARKYALKNQIIHDSWIINNLREQYPEIYHKLVEDLEKVMGKSKKRKEVRIEYIEAHLPDENLYVGSMARKWLIKLREKKENQKEIGCGKFTQKGRCGVNMRNNNTGKFKLYLCPSCQESQNHEDTLSSKINVKINTIKSLVGTNNPECNYKFHRNNCLEDIKEDVKEFIRKLKKGIKDKKHLLDYQERNFYLKLIDKLAGDDLK